MEWDTLLLYFASSIGQDLVLKDGLHYFNNNSSSVQKFQNIFKLPFAGSRNNTNGIFSDNGEMGRYWSSSPNNLSYRDWARRLALAEYSSSSSTLNADNKNYRAYGNSLRCFKDSPKAPETLILTFDAN